MKLSQRKQFTVNLVVVILAICGATRSLQAQSEIRFRLVDNLIVISLKSDQGTAFDFVLDTGADTTVVDPAIVAQLSFVPQDRIRQSTLSGVQTVSRGTLRSLSAGPVLVENVAVLVQDLRALRTIDAHIQGIAGQNFLAQFNYLLDYRKHIVRIELGSELRDSADGARVAFDARNNRMLVPSNAEGRAAASLRLLLDSGASSVVLLPHAVQALSLARQDGGFELTSAGRVALQTGRLRTLKVGSEQLSDLTAALPATEPAERIGDGLLPTVLFQTLYVNNRDGFVVFNPRMKKNAPLQ